MTREEGIKLMMSGKKLKVDIFIYWYDSLLMSGPFRAAYIAPELFELHGSWHNALTEMAFKEAEVLND